MRNFSGDVEGGVGCEVAPNTWVLVVDCKIDWLIAVLVKKELFVVETDETELLLVRYVLRFSIHG